MDRVEPPRVPRKEMRTFDVEQAQAFLAAAREESTTWQTFFTLALYTGAQPGELRGLRWEDVDLEAGTIRIQRHVQRLAGHGIIVGQPKTATGRRPVALGADVVAVVRRHRAVQAAHRLRMGPLWQNNDLVFASEIGIWVEKKQLRIVFARICERAGGPTIRPCDLRHTSARLLLAAGVHPKVVAERLGHASIDLTLSTYSHVLPGLQKDAAETLETALRVAK